MKSHHWKRSTIIILVYFFVIFFACVYLTRSYLYITNEACFNLVHPYFFVPGWVFILNYKNVSHISSFSHSDSLWPHGLPHARLLCPSLSPGVCSNSCPPSRWCIQPSHPLSSPFPSALNLSQHQGLFQWVGSLHQVAKVLELQFKHQSFQLIFRVDFLRIDSHIFIAINNFSSYYCDFVSSPFFRKGGISKTVENYLVILSQEAAGNNQPERYSSSYLKPLSSQLHKRFCRKSFKLKIRQTNVMNLDSIIL